MMKTLKDAKFSVLDLSPITEGNTAADAFRNSLDLAQHAENWGYNRYWVAEHHSMPGIASSATSVLIGYLAGGTSKIRVGSGGIMLPNHAPLVIAEQFGTLESLYPNRIDLGLGRAPGSDQLTANALRRGGKGDGSDFPEMLEDLRNYLKPYEQTGLPVRAIPGEGLNIPIWLLGSSGFSAKLAGELGLPFAFASHFSPDYTIPALQIYHQHFRPSKDLEKPYVMVGANVIISETEERAKYLSTSSQQQFLSLIRGRPTQLKPPVDNMDEVWSPYEKNVVQQQLKSSIIGTQETVAQKLEAFLNETQANEIIVNTAVFDHQERLESFRLLKEIVM
ncbi:MULTISPECIES: LLM class flavin-dependent oxidoreductase [Bacillaceae]|uniref:LLM class flavin-dependent oxidoreductase n=1 Tax=Bacillaceae TaxID=186817 RepID=UPI001E47BA61|nr:MULTISPECIES: LLM class flavin-dependent oxidoreductase [Bacillaceae]MCE4047579.1 LLM class flavin-dependent oxidoreductase [Bacillus sp. Au-Bac7]MCM3033858.1 LLM class flavin-dependent oxidoreductase [Niallia sp. MER 6]